MKFKSLMCVLLCCVMVFSVQVNVFANVDTYEEGQEDENIEYIKFVNNPLARMNSDGTFEFQFTTRVISDKFTANASQIGIITEAYLGTPIGNGQYNYEEDDIAFTMTLKTASGKVVGKYTGYCNGVRGGRTFNVTQGNVYYIELATTADLAPQVKYIMGDGVVTNITVN